MSLVAWKVLVVGYLLATVLIVAAEFDPLAATLVIIGGFLTVVLAAQAVRSPEVQDRHNGRRPHG